MARVPDGSRLMSVRLGRASVILCGALGCGGAAKSERAAAATAGGEGEALPAWVPPEGGVAVDNVPFGGAELKSVDAFGNLWLQGCEGLYVVSDDGIQRYRYQDTPSQHGSATLHPDGQGRMWLAASGYVSMVEAGQWRDVWEGDVYGIVVGADGTAWLRQVLTAGHGPARGQQTIQRLWPEMSKVILAPGWGNAIFPGRDGTLWYATLDDELHRFAEGQFWGPYAMSPTNIHYHYDALDDTFGLSGSSLLTKVGFEGEVLSEVGQWNISWSSALGRLKDGDLAVRGREDRVYVMQGAGSDTERVVASIDAAITQRTHVISPVGELYFGSESAVYHYREGRVERVFELGPASVREAGLRLSYGRALREDAAAVNAAALEPFVPFEAGAKVRITATVRGSLPSAYGVEIDGEVVNAGIAVSPEFAAFSVEQGIGLTTDVDALQQWELIGYLEPGPCYDSGEKVLQVVEAYPIATPREQRARLERELRRRYPE